MSTLFLCFIRLIIILSLVIAITSCKPDESIDIFMAVDTSGSAKSLTKKYFGLTDVIVNKIPWRMTGLYFYTFNSEVTLMWSGKPQKRCLWKVQDRIIQDTRSVQNGTRVDLLLKEFTKSVKSSSADHIGIVIIWDGGADLLKEPLKSFIEKLAEEEKIFSILILGVKDEKRIEVMNMFFPLGDRVICSGLNDNEDALKKFVGKIEKL
jgi:hypothetical protein